ncbi:MAG: hypothetical protein PUP90_21425 [Nostoc sp. S4]|nr:hypothetical protein [Nostoc sp. S4]
MNRLNSWLKNIRIRQIVVVFLVGFMFLLGQAFSYGNVAQADVTTPEGTYYKATPDSQGEIRNDKQIGNVQNKLKDTIDNVREKLNLDEKPPRATREFFDSTKDTDVNNSSGIYESPEGRYRTPADPGGRS